jgi:hypothetical protein
MDCSSKARFPYHEAKNKEFLQNKRQGTFSNSNSNGRHFSRGNFAPSKLLSHIVDCFSEPDAREKNIAKFKSSGQGQGPNAAR